MTYWIYKRFLKFCFCKTSNFVLVQRLHENISQFSAVSLEHCGQVDSIALCWTGAECVVFMVIVRLRLR